MVSGRPTSVNDSISAPAGKLGLFVQPAPPAAWTPCRSRPTAVRGKLALFRTIGPWDRRSPDRHSGGNWVCLYNRPMQASDSRAQAGDPMRLHPQSAVRNRDTASVPRFGKLALFCGGSPRVRCTASPCRHSTCPPNRSRRNWVCFAQLALGPPISGSAQWRKLGLFVQHTTPLYLQSATQNPQSAIDRFGFVFSRPLPCPIRHNSLSTRHLSFLLPIPKLGLFGAEWWNNRTLE